MTLPLRAGDCVVFSTALFHDAAAWTEDYPRLNVFQRFTLSGYFGEFGHMDGDSRQQNQDRLSADGAELETSSYSDHEPAAVVKMRKYWAAVDPDRWQGAPLHRNQRRNPYSWPRL